MQPELQLIRDQQKESWNTFSSGWQKWDNLTMPFMQPVGDEIIRLIQPSGSERILDIASGTGEPGLTIAAMIPAGKVFITDLSEQMLEVARKKVAVSQLRNIEIMACDVSELPFADNTFDAVSCRFGFMFFPDMLMAAREIFRVLKPSGRVATSVWNIPEKNYWVTVTMGTINKNMELPPNPSGAPGMFRCSKPGMLADLFSNAGFSNTTETTINSQLEAGTIENYWSFMTEVGAPIVAALSRADDHTKEKIKTEVFAQLAGKYGQDKVIIDSSALVIYGEK